MKPATKKYLKETAERIMVGIFMVGLPVGIGGHLLQHTESSIIIFGAVIGAIGFAVGWFAGTFDFDKED